MSQHALEPAAAPGLSRLPSFKTGVEDEGRLRHLGEYFEERFAVAPAVFVELDRANKDLSLTFFEAPLALILDPSTINSVRVVAPCTLHITLEEGSEVDLNTSLPETFAPPHAQDNKAFFNALFRCVNDRLIALRLSQDSASKEWRLQVGLPAGATIYSQRTEPSLSVVLLMCWYFRLAAPCFDLLAQDDLFARVKEAHYMVVRSECLGLRCCSRAFRGGCRERREN